MQERGYEGLVAKPDGSAYRPGAWKKVKVRHEGEFELAGIARDRDGLLMLVVGVRDGKALRFAGTVSWGVTRRAVADLQPLIEPLVCASAPFRERVRRMDAVWVEPRIRVELTFAEMVGGVLRDPVYRGLVARSAPALSAR